jgi:1,5-anhydro-D-fructose reductase (1,5-anhydro-D-mannitol-forming)
MIRLAMLSFWHVHAPDYAGQAQQHPGTEIVAVWDEDPGRGEEQAGKLGVDFHSELADVRAREDVDAVIVDTPTNMHREVMVAAAQAGKHIFTEKVLALTVRDAEAIVAAAAAAGVTLMLSLPRLYAGYTAAIQQILDSGTLGDVTLVRTRLSHGGGVDNWLPEHFYDADQCGGGALVDLGCHPMYLARLFLGGLPESVTASFGHVTGRAVDDNAVTVLRYASGALGVVEAGFVNPRSPFSIEIHGTRGSLFYGTPEEKLVVSDPDSAGDWRQLDLPVDQPTAFEQWVDHVQAGTTATANLEIGLDLTRLMEAAYQSGSTSASVSLLGETSA